MTIVPFRKAGSAVVRITSAAEARHIAAYLHTVR